MTKKAAAIIALVAFVALFVPCGHLLSLVCAIVEAVFGVGANPVSALLICLYSLFGTWASILAQIVIYFILPAFLAFFLYRYLLRRDFRQVCEDCAAHRARAWSLFAVFSLFTWLSPASFLIRSEIPEQNEPLPLDEAIMANPAVTLELCLCHPDNDRLVRELRAQGRLTDEVLAGAPALPGYRLMRLKGDEDRACYVSEKVELSQEDVQFAEARKSLGGAFRDEATYEVEVTFTPEGRGKFADVTKANCMSGIGGQGRALAIIVNGELLAAPLIHSPITEGVCVITGAFTREEAVALAAAFSAHF